MSLMKSPEINIAE